MRTIPLMALVLLLAGCESTAPVCTREDVGSPCSQGHTVERDGNTLTVKLRTTVRNRIEYSDGGQSCSYSRTRCIVEECIYVVEGGTMTDEQAILECREQWAR